MKTVYATLWILWAVAFVAIEGTALITGHNQYTLSDYIWRLEEINRTWTALRFFIAAACVFLFFHLAWGLFR